MIPHYPEDEPLDHELPTLEPGWRNQAAEERRIEAGRDGVAQAFAELDAAAARSKSKTYPEYQRKEPRR